VDMEISVLSAEHDIARRKLDSDELECQTLINPGYINKHYILPQDYPVHEDATTDDLYRKNREQYFL
jgi:hypothetical protein